MIDADGPAQRAANGVEQQASSTTTTRLAGELFQSATGVKLLNVPYKTSAAAATALAAGEVDVFFIDSSPMKAMWQTGRVRAIATTGPARFLSLPDLPTLKEEGLAEYEVTGWYSSYYPAKMPPEMVAAMREIVRKASRSTGFQEALKNAAIEPMDMVGEEVTNHGHKEIEMWRKVARTANLKP